MGRRNFTDGDRFFADTLLRRGFPVRFEERGLALCPGAMREDVEFLRRALNGFRRAFPQTEQRRTGESDGLGEEGGALPFFYGEQHGPEHRDLIPTGHTAMLRRFQNRLLPAKPETVSGLTGSPIPGSMDDNFDKFLRCRFGARVPVKGLESGTALLVKTLPWLGVLTSMSCHGHLREENTRRSDVDSTPPRLWFYSQYHSRWCEMIFNRLFQDLPIRESWVFHHGPEDGDWMSATWEAAQTPPENRREQQFLFDQIQLMARRLFDPELCERIRAVKLGATDMDDLERRLDSVL